MNMAFAFVLNSQRHCVSQFLASLTKVSHDDRHTSNMRGGAVTSRPIVNPGPLPDSDTRPGEHLTARTSALALPSRNPNKACGAKPKKRKAPIPLSGM